MCLKLRAALEQNAPGKIVGSIIHMGRLLTVGEVGVVVSLVLG